MRVEEIVVEIVEIVVEIVAIVAERSIYLSAMFCSEIPTSPK